VNTKYLGDNLDLVKRVHFQVCTPYLHNLLVEPLITDSEQWTENALATYATCLGILPNQVHREGEKRWRNTRRGKRAKWLESLGSHYGDLFLDPDTGIDPSKKRGNRRHVPPDSVCALLDGCEGERIVMVYQHTPQRMGSEMQGLVRVARKRVKSVGDEEAGVYSLAVLGQHATMLYFSKAPHRLAPIRAAFGWLGERVMLIPCE